MAHDGEPIDEPAHGLVRIGRAAGRRSDHDERALPVATVRLYHAEDCGLCAHAREALEELRCELEFALELVDIDGDPELEPRYRALLPVVEIDGEPAFTFFVDVEELRSRLAT